MSATGREAKRVAMGLAFLAPNILGVLTFVIFPVIFSIAMAFTDWDIARHNQYRDEPLSFIGLDNFQRLLSERDFPDALGNTLFLMMGMPFAIAAALGAAMLLSKPTRGPDRRVWLTMMAGFGLVFGCAILAAVGAGASSMIILLLGVGAMVLFGGLFGGNTVYRTMFYAPHFTAGVATYLLWKKLYSPTNGPINTTLEPVLRQTAETVDALPPLLMRALSLLLIGVMSWMFVFGVRRLRRWWNDGEIGSGALIPAGILMMVPMTAALFWAPIWPAAAGSVALGEAAAGGFPIGLVLGVAAWGFALSHLVRAVSGPREFRCKPSAGVGDGLALTALLLIGQFIVLGFANVFMSLPEMASFEPNDGTAGLTPPMWLVDFHWAKPALMLMGFWAAIGSNNMLLYLAALSNVPKDLYEAADIDGASPAQRFLNVTWPQLAPTTFFIVVMSFIGGLQGGFEMARTMTRGGPSGATTTLSYLIYQEGFETGRLGYASAAAWALFILVLSVTLLNWRFGNRYVND